MQGNQGSGRSIRQTQVVRQNAPGSALRTDVPWLANVGYGEFESGFFRKKAPIYPPRPLINGVDLLPNGNITFALGNISSPGRECGTDRFAFRSV